MNLYNKLGDLMKKTEYSSSFTLYDDVAMKDEYKDYTSKIQNQEKRKYTVYGCSIDGQSIKKSKEMTAIKMSYKLPMGW